LAEYPKYTINYTGNLVPKNATATEKFNRITIGPHGYVMIQPKANVAIRVEATHEEPIDNTPHITITISQPE